MDKFVTADVLNQYGAKIKTYVDTSESTKVRTIPAKCYALSNEDLSNGYFYLYYNAMGWGYEYDAKNEKSIGQPGIYRINPLGFLESFELCQNAGGRAVWTELHFFTSKYDGNGFDFDVEINDNNLIAIDNDNKNTIFSIDLKTGDILEDHTAEPQYTITVSDEHPICIAERTTIANGWGTPPNSGDPDYNVYMPNIFTIELTDSGNYTRLYKHTIECDNNFLWGGKIIIISNLITPFTDSFALAMQATPHLIFGMYTVAPWGSADNFAAINRIYANYSDNYVYVKIQDNYYDQDVSYPAWTIGAVLSDTVEELVP